MITVILQSEVKSVKHICFKYFLVSLVMAKIVRECRC